jgi:hypothetical protein
VNYPHQIKDYGAGFLLQSSLPSCLGLTRSPQALIPAVPAVFFVLVLFLFLF